MRLKFFSFLLLLGLTLPLLACAPEGSSEGSEEGIKTEEGTSEEGSSEEGKT